MEEDHIHDAPKGYWTQSRPLEKIIYLCPDCGHQNERFQPLLRPTERSNADYRQHCSVCKKIVNHLRYDPFLPT